MCKRGGCEFPILCTVYQFLFLFKNQFFNLLFRVSLGLPSICWLSSPLALWIGAIPQLVHPAWSWIVTVSSMVWGSGCLPCAWCCSGCQTTPQPFCPFRCTLLPRWWPRWCGDFDFGDFPILLCTMKTLRGNSLKLAMWRCSGSGMWWRLSFDHLSKASRFALPVRANDFLAIDIHPRVSPLPLFVWLAFCSWRWIFFQTPRSEELSSSSSF